MTAPRATLLQVARHAGVSLASASRALHGTGASPAMVDRVRTASVALGYRPHETGRSLRMRRTFQVAFAVADIGNPVYIEMLTAIHAVLEPHGYRVVVMSTGSSVASTVDLVQSLEGGFVDGMIISPLRVDDALVAAVEEAAVPVVVIGRSLSSHGIDSVSTDSAGGIAQAVEHLLAAGRRRIGFVNGPLDTTPGEARQRGFDAATSSASFAAVAERVGVEVAADFTVAAGFAAANRLLDRAADAAAQSDGAPLDAVVAANDLLAIGVIRAASERGVGVPHDLAVTGMDDTDIGRVFQPSLTSVSLGSSRRGQIAADLMLGLVEDAAERGRYVSVGPELVVRDSSVATPSPARPTPARKEDA